MIALLASSRSLVRTRLSYAHLRSQASKLSAAAEFEDDFSSAAVPSRAS